MASLSSLDNLRCFLAAARTLNFRRAAKSVALTPTAFSQRIRQLEEHLGVQLFVRSTRSMTLTEAALTLIPAAERCLEAARDCERVGTTTSGHPEMEMTLGTRQELGLSWVLAQRTVLLRARPWLHLHLYFSSGPDLLLRVRTVEIDCAITSTPLNDPKLDAMQLHREDYAFVGGRTLLARQPLRRAEDAARHTLLDASSDLPLFRYWRDAEGGGDRLRFGNRTWLGSIAAIKHQVIAGEGVAVLPEYYVRSEIASGKLRIVFPSVRPVHDHFRLVFRASDPRRAVYESFAADLMRTPLH